jgi:hydroxyacylglutathione hydrolase
MLTQFQNDDVLLLESDLFRTVTTIITGEDYVLLVDPNWLPREVEYIAGRVGELAQGKQLYLLFTHSDYDHIIGYERFPEATTIASAAFTTNPGPESILTQIRDFDDSYYLTRSYGISYPEIDIVVEGDGTIWQLGADEFIFLQSPGHNRDGLMTFLPAKGVLIVGDYLSNIEFPYVYHGVGEYRQTLNKLETLIESQQVKLLVTGHGDATSDIAEMRSRLADSRAYLDALETSVREKTPFDTAGLYARYGFPKVMGDFQAGNVKLMEGYLGISV